MAGFVKKKLLKIDSDRNICACRASLLLDGYVKIVDGALL